MDNQHTAGSGRPGRVARRAVGVVLLCATAVGVAACGPGNSSPSNSKSPTATVTPGY